MGPKHTQNYKQIKVYKHPFEQTNNTIRYGKSYNQQNILQKHTTSIYKTQKERERGSVCVCIIDTLLIYSPFQTYYTQTVALSLILTLTLFYLISLFHILQYFSFSIPYNILYSLSLSHSHIADERNQRQQHKTTTSKQR